MKPLLILLAAIALGLIVIPACTMFLGSTEHGTVKTLMLIGTVLWFASAIPLMGLRKKTPGVTS